MSQATLAAAAAFSVVSALVYFQVARVVAMRSVSADASLAATGFRLWWAALAGSTLLGSLDELIAVFGEPPLGLLIAVGHISLALTCVALWGLLYYLLYLFTGRRRLWMPLAAFYAVYFFVLFGWLLGADATGVEVGRWSVDVSYAKDLADSVLWLPVLAFLLLPQILGSIAYFTLYWRVEERSQKFRVAVVSWSIIIWFGSAGVASLSEFGQEDLWQVTSRFIGLAAAGAILAAYRPPALLRRTLRVEAL